MKLQGSNKEIWEAEYSHSIFYYENRPGWIVYSARPILHKFGMLIWKEWFFQIIAIQNLRLNNVNFRGVSTRFMDNYLFWHRFLEMHKSLDKTELKKTLLTQVLATNVSTLIKDLLPKRVA